MIDIIVQNKALKLLQIPHILENTDSFWVQSLQANLQFLIDHILLENFNKKDMENCMGKHVLVWNASILVRTNIQGQNPYIPGCSKPTTMAQPPC